MLTYEGMALSEGDFLGRSAAIHMRLKITAVSSPVDSTQHLVIVVARKLQADLNPVRLDGATVVLGHEENLRALPTRPQPCEDRSPGK